MNSKYRLFLFLLLVFTLSRAALAQTSAFTYQGKLTDGGNPANGQYDIVFKLFDIDIGGTELAPQQLIENVQVTNGVFTVELSFDFPPFTNVAANYLELGVRPGTSTSAFTTLSPRSARMFSGCSGTTSWRNHKRVRV